MRGGACGINGERSREVPYDDRGAFNRISPGSGLHGLVDSGLAALNQATRRYFVLVLYFSFAVRCC